MTKARQGFVVIAAAMILVNIARAADEMSVMPEKIDSIGKRAIDEKRDVVIGEYKAVPEKVGPTLMMEQYLQNLMDKTWEKWQSDYEQLKTSEQIAERQKKG